MPPSNICILFIYLFMYSEWEFIFYSNADRKSWRRRVNSYVNGVVTFYDVCFQIVDQSSDLRNVPLSKKTIARQPLPFSITATADKLESKLTDTKNKKGRKFLYSEISFRFFGKERSEALAWWWCGVDSAGTFGRNQRTCVGSSMNGGDVLVVYCDVGHRRNGMCAPTATSQPLESRT